MENRWLGATPFRVDLTRWAEGEYAYQVKFEWTDRKGTGRVGVEKLKFDTWVELSPWRCLGRDGNNAFRVASAPLRAVYSRSRWTAAGPSGRRREHGGGDQIPYLRPQDRRNRGC